jgi:chromosome segregation ATPase
MTRDNLERFQDTYAEAMVKYGLQRGVRGSEARHISNQQHYRDLYVKKEELKLDVVDLEERKQEVNDKIRNMYDHRDEAREQFLDMHERNKQKETEIVKTEARLEQLQRDYEPYRAQDDLNLLT